MKVLNEEKASSQQIKALEAKIKRASDIYYNTGKIIMPDKEFDKLVEELKVLSPKSKVLQQIGAPVKRQKVKLMYFMGSLDKIKAENADTWLQNKRPKNGYCVSDKIDGVSILIVYTPKEIKAFTRGDGTYGQDISFLVPHLGIPTLKTNLVLRAEIVMPVSRFETWKKDFENPRNLVSGIVNRKSIHRATRDLDVIVYEQISPRIAQSQALEKLKGVGFKVVPFKIFKDLNSSLLSELLKSRKQKSKYEIDGLVVTVNDSNPVNTMGNPSWAKAFKEVGEGAVQEAEVVDVHWEISKRGLLKPRVEIKPLRLSGVTVKFATGFNAKFIEDNKIGPGAKIKIVRSGDVIPHIMEVVKPAKTARLPTDKEFRYMWNKTGVDIVAIDKKSHKSYQVKRLNHFFKTLGVENFSIGLIERFLLDGLDSIGKITKASKKRLLQVNGIQEKSAEKIYSNIQTAIKNVPLDKLMDASGLFENMAQKKIKKVLDKYPKILDSFSKVPTQTLVDKLKQVEGFSDVSAKEFAKGLPKFVAFVNKYPNITYVVPKEKKTQIKGKLAGKSFVFTGFRDRHLESTLESKGGKIGAGVTKTTTILIVKDKSAGSTKIQKAEALGVKVMDANEFRRWLDKQ